MSTVRAPNAYRLLWAGFFAIFASGVGFSVRARVLSLWAADYGFTMTELGEITGGALWGFGLIILLGSLIADRVGYGTLMVFALLSHGLSAVLQLCTGPIYDYAGKDGVYYSLYIASFLFSVGNGVCEAVVNPVVATLFPDKKTHYLNILHAGWPGGLIVGGFLAYFMNNGQIGDWVPLGKVPWIWQMSMFLIPVIIYGLMILGQKFPQSEASQAGVNYGTMLLQLLSPLLIMLLIIQALVGYVELGTDSWISKITGNILGGANYGQLLFIYMSGLMFILRFFGGPIEHRLSPLGLLCVSAVLGCTGLTLLSRVEKNAVVMCVLAGTVYAMGKTFLWPTMLAVTSERFPKGGAIAIGAVGGAGMLSAGLLGGPGIGFNQDYYASSALKTNHEATYERYKSEDKNSFLYVFHVQGLDGKKTNRLELDANLNAEIKKIETTQQTAEKQDLERDKKVLELEIANADKKAIGKNETLGQWWQEIGDPHKADDKKPLEGAELYGSQMALQVTAAVPATMAVLYLLLIGYFRMRGGYTKEVVLTTAAPASEY